MAKKTGHGVQLKVDDDDNGSFTTIAQLRQVKGPNITRAKIDATTLDDAIVSYIAGDPKELGDITFIIAYDPNSATHQTLKSLADSGSVVPWQTVMANYSTSKTWQFRGFVQNFDVGEMVSNQLVLATLTITLTTDYTVN